MKKRIIRESLLASTIIGGAALSFMAATPAFAQSAEEEVSEVSSIVVTGSRIRQPGYEAASPIASVSSEDIALSQPVAIEELVKDLPAAVPAVGSATNNGSGGGATINLRGLGTNRTLVLINGRRVVPFNLSGVVDTNTIPVALVERIDTVTGGASAVYGADAVAGVVNFILKNNFEGVEFSSSYGFSGEDDAVRRKFDLTVGGNFAEDRGNAVVSFGYTKTDPLYQDRRPWGTVARSSTTGAPLGSGTSVPGRFGVTPFQVKDADGNVIPELSGTPLPSGAELDPTTGALIGSNHPNYNSAGYNYNPYNLYQTPLSRYQINALGSFKINPAAEVYSHLSYVQSDVSLDNASSGTFGNVYSVPIGNPFIPDAMRQQLCDALMIGANKCVSGPGGDTMMDLTINRRFTEMGTRPVDIENKTVQLLAGVRGDFNPDWNYDAYISHGETQQLTTRRNWGSLSKLKNALNTVSADQCLVPGADPATGGIAGCVPINVFGPEGSITQEMIDYINLSSMSKVTIKQDVASGSISGVLPERLSSPWSERPIAIAFGAEWRRSSAATRGDEAAQTNGEVLGTGAPVPDREGQFEMREAFAELAIPLIENLPFIHSLNLEAGYRQTEFKAAGVTSHYGSYKLGGDWSPIEDVRIRAMYQRATRAPNIGELFNPQVTGLNNRAEDPCQQGLINPADANKAGTLSNLCRLTGVPDGNIGNVAPPNSGQVNVLTGGNPNLGPEEADTWTIGAVWQPAFVPSLRLSVDYYDIKVDKTVGSPSVDDILNGCYSTTLNPNLEFNEFCKLIGRNTKNGSLNGVESKGVTLLSSNLGNDRVSGFDLAGNYRVELADFGWGDIGRVDLSVNGNIVTRFESQADPNSVLRDCVGYYSVSCGEPKVKQRWSSRATWSMGDYSASLQWRHLSGVEVEPSNTKWFPDYAQIDSYDYFDLSGRWDITQTVRLTATINNLFDKAPPMVGSQIGSTSANNGNTFPQTYDAIGRYFTFGATLKF
ncbi:MAG: TonB-dependent receptor [Brevundimonas sp.]|uniref:TonB-dependent receptor domain-containing protein n=1 Tax=Brevundimonas sp. TaxID=1871086 RepID=UPI0025C63E48|nr:TonB-dependent receptor [Brevundimonas sp.]MCH4269961.1 TonB-dependent receptor [Brevundimonas sp.]